MSVVKYNFKWPSGPTDVVVTGEFDEWEGTSHLRRNPESGEFETTLPVRIPEGEDRVHFKFIVDGEWTTSGFYKIVTDAAGNENNFIPNQDLRSLAMKRGMKGGSSMAADKKNTETKRHSSPPLVKSSNHHHLSTHRGQYEHENEKENGYRHGRHEKPEIIHDDAALGAAKAGPIAAQEFLDLFADSNDPTLKKVKIKRKIKRNKKTGERIVISEEKIPLRDDHDSMLGSTTEEENMTEVESYVGSSDLANAAAGAASNSARQRQQPYASLSARSNAPFTPPSTRRSRPLSTSGIPRSSHSSSGVLRNGSGRRERPVSMAGVPSSTGRPKSGVLAGSTVSRGKGAVTEGTSPSGGENGTFESLAGEPGPFIPTKKEQLKAFNEVNDNVDPEAFNERLNNEYKSKASGQKLDRGETAGKLDNDENKKKLERGALHGKDEIERSDNNVKGVDVVGEATNGTDIGPSAKFSSGAHTKDALNKLSKDDDLKKLGKDAIQGKVDKNDAVKELDKDSTVKGIGKDLASDVTNKNGGIDSGGVSGASDTGIGMESSRDTGTTTATTKADTKDALGKLSKDNDLKQLGRETIQGKVNKDDALKKLGKDSTLKDVGENLASDVTKGGNATTAGGAGDADMNVKSGINSGTAENDKKDVLSELRTDDSLKQLGKDAVHGKVSKDEALNELGKDSTVKDVGEGLASDVAKGGDGEGIAALDPRHLAHREEHTGGGDHGKTPSNDDAGHRGIPTDIERGVPGEKDVGLRGPHRKADLERNEESASSNQRGISEEKIRSDELQKKAIGGDEPRTRHKGRTTLDPKAENGSQRQAPKFAGRRLSEQYHDLHTDSGEEEEVYLDPLNGSSLGDHQVGSNSSPVKTHVSNADGHNVRSSAVGSAAGVTAGSAAGKKAVRHKRDSVNPPVSGGDNVRPTAVGNEAGKNAVKQRKDNVKTPSTGAGGADVRSGAVSGKGGIAADNAMNSTASKNTVRQRKDNIKAPPAGGGVGGDNVRSASVGGKGGVTVDNTTSNAAGKNTIVQRKNNGKVASTNARGDNVHPGAVSGTGGNAATSTAGRNTAGQKKEDISAPPDRTSTTNGRDTKAKRRSISIPFVRRNKGADSRGSRPKSISGAVSNENRLKKPVNSKRPNEKGGPVSEPAATLTRDTGVNSKEGAAVAEPGTETNRNKGHFKELATDIAKTTKSGVENGKTQTQIAKDVLKQGTQGGSGQPVAREAVMDASKEATAAEESKIPSEATAPNEQAPQSVAQSAAASAVKNAEKKKKLSIWAKVKRALL